MPKVVLDWDYGTGYRMHPEDFMLKGAKEDTVFDLTDEEFNEYQRVMADYERLQDKMEQLETDRKRERQKLSLSQAKEKQIERLLTAGYNF